jgi:hypothetical protein
MEYMRRTYWNLLPIILGSLCFILFKITDSTIDEQGILREPFYLILFGYGFVLLGIILTLIKIMK